MERGNINKCYICGTAIRDDQAGCFYFDLFPKDNTSYNEDICKECESVVKDVKEFFKNRLKDSNI